MPTAKNDTKVQVNVRLPRSTADQLRVVAEVEDKNVSDVAAEAFRRHIEYKKADAAWQEKHHEWANRQKALLKALRP